MDERPGGTTQSERSGRRWRLGLRRHLDTAAEASLGYVPPALASRTRTDTSLEDHATPDQQRGMSAFWWDGVWASVAEATLLNYLGVYLIAFGGTTAQVGLLAALTSLASAVALFPGARFIEVTGRRKATVIVTGGIASRVLLASFALVPFFSDGTTAVWIVIGLASIRSFFGFFSVPAWTSLAADVVPIGLRGRFFASRTAGMGVAGLIAAPAAGWLIGAFAGFEGWQLVWLISALAGMVSTFYYARIPEPPMAAPPTEGASRTAGMFRDIFADANFRMCLVSVAVWNVALQAAGPFFNVYLVKELGASTTMVGLLAAVPALTGLFGLRYFGGMMDSLGTRHVLRITGLLIPLMPFLWIFVTAPWQVIFINAAAGVLWAGYTLANSNVVMVLAPPEKRARYTAAFQAVTFAASFAGPLLGGWLIGIAGYYAIFLASAVGRLAGTAVLLRVHVPLREPAPAAA